MTRKLVSLLSRVGLTGVAGLIASLAASVRSREYVRIQRTSCGWIHSYCGIAIVLGEWWSNPREHVESGYGVFYFNYAPRVGDICLDLGAGNGTEVIDLCGRVGPTGLVVAIEPNPIVFERLLATVRLNSLSNCLLLNIAVGDQQGVQGLRFSPTSDADGVAGRTSPDLSSDSLNVAMTTLDELIGMIGAPEISFLKMNIEGGEESVLAEAEHAFSSVRNWCISCHDFLHDPAVATYGSVVRRMQEFGLSPVLNELAPIDSAASYYVYATRPDSRVSPLDSGERAL